MLKLLNLFYVGALILALNSNASAQSSQAEIPEDDSKRCEFIGEMAYIVMTARQRSIDIASMMNTTGESLGRLGREIVMDAYDSPLLRSPENKSEATAEFRNRWTLKCYQQEIQ